MEINHETSTIKLVKGASLFLKENIKQLLIPLIISTVFSLIIYFLCAIIAGGIFTSITSYVYFGGSIDMAFVFTAILFLIFIFIVLAIFAILQALIISVIKHMTVKWIMTGEPPKLKDSFNEIKSILWRVIFSNIIKFCFLYLFIVLITGLLTASIFLGIMGDNNYIQINILNIIAVFYFVYFYVRFSFNMDFIIFKDDSIIKSIKSSFKLTKGKFTSIIKYYILWLVGSCLLHFVIGVVTKFILILTMNIIFISLIVSMFLGVVTMIPMIILHSMETIKFVDLCEEENRVRNL